tara:strand:- start:1134 stop:2072 length:939 start_codon:yes stop_codon:yes gene_type:complete
MKVHNFTIDSSQRDPTLHANPNDYTVTLDDAIYDVSQIKLVSGRIPTSQLLVCDSNQSFQYEQDGTTYGATVPVGNYDGASLAAVFNSNWNITYNASKNSFGVGTPVDGQITFKFKTGSGGYDDVNSKNTTMHQILGLPAEDIGMPGGQFGAANLKGPNSLVLRISSGSEKFNQSVYTSEPYYTGHILLDGTDFVNVSGTDDKVTHTFHSGALKSVKDIRIEFFYMSHGRLIPYDFRNQDHVLKFEITCSTDKLENLAPLEDRPVEEGEEEVPEISIPEKRNLYEWKIEYIYITLIIFTGFILILSMGKKRS